MLPAKIRKLISGKQWYHQRFDGSPMFLFAVGEAEVYREKRKPAGTEADIRVSFYHQDKADWYLDMADIKRGAEVMMRLAKRDPNISTKLLRAWRKDELAFKQFFWKEFPRLNLRTLTNQQLVDLWQRYYNLFTKRFTSSSIIDHFALGTDELIGEMLRKEAGPFEKESQFSELFAIATAPVKQSFINEAEIELLKIATTENARNNTEKRLREYQKKYFWTKNNYAVAKALTINDFKWDIRAWRKSGKNLTKELSHILRTPSENKRKKAVLFRKYRFSKLLRTLLKISEDFSWWQDERKKSTYLNIHIGFQILSEIGRRIGYSVDELKYAVAPEIPAIIGKQQPSRKELKARHEGSVFVVTREGYYVGTGSDVSAARQMMFGSQKLDEIKDLRGLVAMTGKTIGTAKVLMSANEIGKVQPGDILIAVMTRPDYVPAMKRAAAIVTDEGGITSHAAIVSRELGIPCIIGTKIATRVLKDGDKLEVNANHNWVRKL